MDRGKKSRKKVALAAKKNITKYHMNNLKSFVEKILKKTIAERKVYFNDINVDEIKLIEEIFVNFLASNIDVDVESYRVLKRLKSFLYTFVKKNRSISLKRRFLKTLRGLALIKILFPFVLEAL